jgi:hypothetical protein
VERGARFPVAGERKRVLRTLRTQLPAETIGVYAVQGFRDTSLVSVDEPGDFDGRRGVQRLGGADLLAATGCGQSCAGSISRMVMVRPTKCDVRLGAGGHCTAGLGFSGVERSAPESQGMVHAEASDIFFGRGSCAHVALVGSRWPAAGPVSGDDRKISRRAWGTGLGSSADCCGVAVQRRGISGLPAGTWEGAERGQRGGVAGGIDDDDRRMVDYLLKEGKRTDRGFWSSIAVFRLDEGKEESRPLRASRFFSRGGGGFPFSFTLRELVPADGGRLPERPLGIP